MCMYMSYHELEEDQGMWTPAISRKGAYRIGKGPVRKLKGSYSLRKLCLLIALN